MGGIQTNILNSNTISSRFTDSRKYEENFLECFKLSTPRQGEICNACVLLVKRWKKLPAGSTRNWQHVVDARSGPGIKSMTKFKSKSKKKALEKIETIKKEKHFEREYSPLLSDKSDGNDEVELTEMDFLIEEGPSAGSSRAASPEASDYEEVYKKNWRDKESDKHSNNIPVSDFVDLDYWKRETLCCGTIYRGLYNEIMVDPTLMKPCCKRIKQYNMQCEKKPNKEGNDVMTKIFSDSNSDSGYDESSNQEMCPENSFKKDPVSLEGINCRTQNVN